MKFLLRLRSVSLSFLLILLLTNVGFSFEDDAEPAPHFHVGFAKMDVTPTTPQRLSGYGSRNKPFESVAQPLFARAMALRYDEGPVHLLVSVDVIGFPGVFTTEVQKRLESKHGIHRKQFVLCATHTHTGPHIHSELINIFATPLTEEEKKNAAEYARNLADGIVKIAGEAIGDLQPSRLLLGEGSVGFAANRRVLKDGRWTGFGVNADGPVDHSLPVLKVVGTDGSLRGLVFNYACHCTTLGGNFNRVTGDWAGYAAEYLEDKHDGIVALCTIGCGADANPEPRGELEMAQAHGRALALEVEKTIAKDLKPIDDTPTSSFGFAGLPFDRPPISELHSRLESNSPQTRRNAEHLIEVHKRMGRLPETYPAPIQTWRFGDELTMVFLGGEVVVDYALRLKREIKSELIWVTAYANDVFGYVASERVRKEGGYEVDRSMVYYNQPGPWAEGTEEVLIRRIHEVLKNPEGEGPRDPGAALKSFQLPDGLEIELVASEPLVRDPVNFSFGPDGKLWVVEMGDYPRGEDGQGKPGGRVRFLVDNDGDGVFDAGTLFLDGLPYPTGVAPWRNGVLISAAPNILYAEDTDGDGRADKTEVLYSGFVESNPQHRINGFAYGLDGWWYLGSGQTNGTILSVKTGERLNMSGRDLRIFPETGDFRVESGRTQYGRSRDDWGNWFGGSNSKPIYHFVLPDQFLERNESVFSPDPKVHLLTPETAPPVFPNSRTVDRFNDLFAANRFTSACSPAVFRDTSLGDDLYGDGFICEPVHNLVHRTEIEPAGVTFRGRRHPSEEQSEFLSSTDTWFRPARVTTGPDGALWVADMYRLVIEHPQWIPEDWQARLNLRAGEDRGRIYRIFRRGNRPGGLPNLSKLSTPQLVEQMHSANGTVRDLAQQLLIERADESAVQPLVEIIKQQKTPTARLQALATLAGMNSLDATTLKTALADDDPRVVRFALRLLPSFIDEHLELERAALELARHADVRVRFQLALALGDWNNPRAAIALGKLAASDPDDRWMRTATLSSAAPHADRILESVLSSGSHIRSTPGQVDLIRDLIITALHYGDQAEAISHLIADFDGAPQMWQIVGLTALADALERRRTSWRQLLNRLGNEHETAIRLNAIIARARELAVDSSAESSEREAAVELLGRAFDEECGDLDRLASLLRPQSPPELQSTVIRALIHTNSGRSVELLLADWRQHSPTIQAEIVQALISHLRGAGAVLDAIEQEKVHPTELSASARNQLLEHNASSIRDRATKLLASFRTASRQKVLEEFASALEISGDPIRGGLVFARTCAACHRLGHRGTDRGPNLAALTDKSPQALLTAILDPHQAVESKYRQYNIATRDGRLHSGMILSETATSLTLALPTGKTEELLRSDVEELASSVKSFMPEGLEKDLTPQDLADVIAYVRFPPPARVEPRGIKGNLVICGGGPLPESVKQRFMELAGGNDARIVVIPTAGARADRDPDETFTRLWEEYEPASLTMLHTRSRDQADTEEFVAPLAEATAVWFTGGSQSRIAEAYLGTRVEEELMKLLERGGVIGGTSAGAAIQSRVMIASGNPLAVVKTGFDCLPGFVIDQHFIARNRKPRLIGVLQDQPGLVGLGIDEGTAVIVSGRSMQVLGESTVTVLLSESATKRPRETILRDRDRADLIALRRAARDRAYLPFPIIDFPPTKVKNGSLVIVGGGGLPSSIIERFVELAGGPEANIVVLPTALPDRQARRETVPRFFQRAGANNVTVWPQSRLEEVESEEFLTAIRNADGVWFGGGRQWRFVDAYERTKAFDALHEVLARGGVIGGSSAGASIQAEYLVRGHPLGNRVMMAEGYERGFCFLPGVAIDQHFAQRNRFGDMQRVKLAYPQLLGIGVDETTALVVQGSIGEVIGRGEVHFFDVCDPELGDVTEYESVPSGGKYDLIERTPIELSDK